MQPESELMDASPTPEDLAAALESGAASEQAAVDEADLHPAGPEDAFAGEDANDPRRLHRRLEALLFVASEALPIEKLVRLTNAGVEEVATALSELEAEYQDRGITVRLVAGGYRFATAPRVRDVVEAYLLPPKTNLSAAAMETLAIIAYSQPITKAEIEAIRGVSVDGVVSSLVERGMVAECGRKETVGKPMLFGTTTQFLEAFGLGSLADLPLLPEEQAERLSAETATPAILEGTMAEDADGASSAETVTMEQSTLEISGAVDPTDPGPMIDPVDPTQPQPVEEPVPIDNPAEPPIAPVKDSAKPDAYMDSVEAISEEFAEPLSEEAVIESGGRDDVESVDEDHEADHLIGVNT